MSRISEYGNVLHVYMHLYLLYVCPQLPNVTQELTDVQNSLDGINLTRSIDQVRVHNMLTVTYYRRERVCFQVAVFRF